MLNGKAIQLRENGKRKKSRNVDPLTLELRMSYICDMHGRALSVAVGFLRQSSQVTLSARS